MAPAGTAAVARRTSARRHRTPGGTGTAAVPAGAIGPGQPGDADPVAGPEPGRSRAGGGDLPDHLVPWSDAGRPGRQVTLGQVQVGPADPAADHPDQQLTRAGLGHRPVDQPQRPGRHRPGLVHHPCAHAMNSTPAEYWKMIGIS